MAGLTHEKIAIDALMPGMYISRLDRPWIDTPFPIQGFHVKDRNDVKNLKEFCDYVYIDRQRSSTTIRLGGGRETPPQTTKRVTEEVIRVNHTTYRREKTMDEIVGQASMIHQDVVRTLDRLSEQVAQGKAPDIMGTRQTADKVVDNVACNPDAMIWIAHLKAKDNHSYAHSIRATIWAIAFGRHLGIKKALLQDIATGMLMADIGMTHIPDTITGRKGRLNKQEKRILHSHVAKSLEMLKGCKGLNRNILEVIATHHERHDGSGYPRGIRGTQIPLHGKVAGLVDYYDTLTNPRHIELALSPADAIVKLHKMRFNGFQGDLVDEFIQATGIYPTGSLIELKTGEVGVISEQNEGWRLRPRIMILLNQEKKRIGKPATVDLLNPEDKASHLEIKRSLPDGSFGLDLTDFRASGLSRFLGLGNTLFA